MASSKFGLKVLLGLVRFRAVTVVALVVAGVAVAPAPASAAKPGGVNAANPTPIPGTPVTVQQLGQATVAQLTARGRNLTVAAPQPSFQLPRPNRAGRQESPGSQNLIATASPHRPRFGTTASAPQTIGTTFTGSTLADQPTTFPPDTMGAAGPTQYIVATNARVRSFDKVTGMADAGIDMTLRAFWSPATGNTSVSDPRIRYDRFTQRWYLSSVTFPSGNPLTNAILVAYSAGPTITGTTVFTFVAIQINVAGPCALDYDTLGIDVHALYIGGDVFCGPTFPQLAFLQSEGFVFNKAMVLGAVFKLTGSGTVPGNCSAVGAPDDGPTSPQGVDNGDPNATVGYFFGSAFCEFGELAWGTVTNPGTAQAAITLHFLMVPPTWVPQPAPATGASHPLDAIDDRLINVVLRKGEIWAAHTICVDTLGIAAPGPVVSGVATCAAGARDGIRWYALNPSTPTLDQAGTVFDNTAMNPVFYFIPSINTSGQGHTALGFTQSSTSTAPQGDTVGRLAGDPLGTMRAVSTYQASAFTYNAQPTANPQRWGDYSMTTVDPNDDMTMWTIQEFANAADSWGVEVAQLKAPGPATPTATDGTVVFTNQCSQLINVTGTSVSGTGWFDPGPGFANRLMATVSGGVTVNKTTVVDPTHLILDISTQGAATGLKDLTVTNPDGQSITAVGFLNVTGASSQPDTMTATSLQQYSLSNSDGITWVEIDPALRVKCTPAADQWTVATANVDLFTGQAGYNQDVAIFVSDNGGADTLLAWKESGGFAGVFSPNAAFVQAPFQMLATHTYVFKLKWKTNKPAAGATIYAAAGPGPFPWSNTGLVVEVFPNGNVPVSKVSQLQYSLSNNDGVNWVGLDPANLDTAPIPTGVAGTLVASVNVDLFTGQAGYNQDIAIYVSVDGGADQLLAWKESGGFAGVFSPNAAYVKTAQAATAGHTYAFKVKWKANKNAAGATIWAGAGPGPFPWSHTSLVVTFIPATANAVFTQVSTNQYSLSNNDGASWAELDSALRVNVAAATTGNSIAGVNIDLFTGKAGYNQDVAIFVSDNGGADQLLVWKESGGFAGVFSPNAAAAQATSHMVVGHNYVFKVKWKANKNAAGATIYAAAGPGPAPWSHTRLIVELTN